MLAFQALSKCGLYWLIQHSAGWRYRTIVVFVAKRPSDSSSSSCVISACDNNSVAIKDSFSSWLTNSPTFCNFIFASFFHSGRVTSSGHLTGRQTNVLVEGGLGKLNRHVFPVFLQDLVWALLCVCKLLTLSPRSLSLSGGKAHVTN